MTTACVIIVKPNIENYGEMMIFKCIYEFINSDIERLNLRVNDFIKVNEERGYYVVKQETVMQQHPRKQDLVVLVSVWMDTR